MFTLLCPNCHRSLSARQSTERQAVACPHCQFQFAIPPAPAANPDESHGGWIQAMTSVRVVLALIGSFIAVISGAYALIRNTTPDTPPPVLPGPSLAQAAPPKIEFNAPPPRVGRSPPSLPVPKPSGPETPPLDLESSPLGTKLSSDLKPSDEDSQPEVVPTIRPSPAAGLASVKQPSEIEPREKPENPQVPSTPGLFSDDVKKLAEREDATAALRKALTSLPQLLRTELKGKPTIDRATSEMVATASISVDPQAYRAFAEELESSLRRYAKRRETTLTKAVPVALEDGKVIPDVLLVKQTEGFSGPAIGDDDHEACVVWVCATPGKGANIRWNGYVVELKLREVLQPIVPTYEHGSSALPENGPRTFVRFEALDRAGKILVEDEVLMTAMPESNPFNHNPKAAYPWVCYPFTRLRVTNKPLIPSGSVMGVYGELEPTYSLPKAHCRGLLIAPFSMKIRAWGDSPAQFYYRPITNFTSRIKLSAEELAEIGDVRTSLVFKAAGR